MLKMMVDIFWESKLPDTVKLEVALSARGMRPSRMMIKRLATVAMCLSVTVR